MTYVKQAEASYQHNTEQWKENLQRRMRAFHGAAKSRDR